MILKKYQIVVYQDDLYTVQSKPFKILHSDMVVLLNQERKITVNVDLLSPTNLYAGR